MSAVEASRAVRMYKLGGYLNNQTYSNPSEANERDYAKTNRNEYRPKTIIEEAQNEDEKKKVKDTVEVYEKFDSSRAQKTPRTKDGKMFSIRGTTKTLIEVTTREVVEDNAYKMPQETTEKKLDQEREDRERKQREDQEKERKLKEELERKAREEAERKAREEKERKLKEDQERKLKEEQERERKLKEEQERKAREETERKAREQQEAERQRLLKEEQERKEKERKEREEAEKKAKEERERKETERRLKREEQERLQREERERKVREEQERREVDRRQREERERQEREEKERKRAQEEQERKNLAKNAQIHSIRNQSIQTQKEEPLKDTETSKIPKKNKQPNVEASLKPKREPRIHSIRKTNDDANAEKDKLLTKRREKLSPDKQEVQVEPSPIVKKPKKKKEKVESNADDAQNGEVQKKKKKKPKTQEQNEDVEAKIYSISKKPATNNDKRPNKLEKEKDDDERLQLPIIHLPNAEKDKEQNKRYEEDLKLPSLVTEKQRPHAHKLTLRDQSKRVKIPSREFYDPGYKRCPCLMHSRDYYRNGFPPVGEESYDTRPYNAKEQHITHDYWNCRHEYEIIFGQKYLGYHPCRPTPRRTKEMNKADYYDHWKMNNLDLANRPPWNPMF